MSTWTAAFSIFGVVALTLWLARLAAARGTVVAVPAALLLAVIGVVSNFRYELTFPALPLTLLALVLVPVSDLEHKAAGRRAKWLLGSAYAVGFVAVLVANRMTLRPRCAPVAGALFRRQRRARAGDGPDLRVQCRLQHPGDRSRNGPSPAEPAVGAHRRHLDPDAVVGPDGAGAGCELALVWGYGGRRQTESAGPEETRAQAVLCVLAAALLIAGGLGAAAVMSLSVRAQSLVAEMVKLFVDSAVTGPG